MEWVFISISRLLTRKSKCKFMSSSGGNRASLFVSVCIIHNSWDLPTETWLLFCTPCLSLVNICSYHYYRILHGLLSKHLFLLGNRWNFLRTFLLFRTKYRTLDCFIICNSNKRRVESFACLNNANLSLVESLFSQICLQNITQHILFK